MLRLSYIDKYKSNKNWADSAYTGAEYDIATNRYYYSIFQKILLTLDNNHIPIDSIDGEGSHDHTARLFVENCLTGKDFKKKTRFNTGFQNLKKYRKKADYKAERISNVEITEVKELYRQLDSIVN